jgi:hypothetical protein
MTTSNSTSVKPVRFFMRRGRRNQPCLVDSEEMAPRR